MFGFRREKAMVINGEKEITLRKICAAMGIAVPNKFRGIQDTVNNNITLIASKITEGSIYINLDDHINVKKTLDNAVKKGAIAIFIDEKEFINSGINIDEYPCILMNNKIEQVGNVFSQIRDSYNAKIVAITGTVGKTTTNMFSKTIISNRYNTFNSSGNLNHYMRAADHILNKLTKDTEVFVQEVGAFEENRVRKCGSILRPDVFIILNVMNHHLETYKTYENLFKDKVSIDDYVKDDGTIIVNYDDEGLAAHNFKHKVISFGINTKRQVDFRAVDIVQNKEFLEFDIVYGNKKTHIKINVLGTQNTYNALAAFALAKYLKISDSAISKNFLQYRSNGIRQNLVNIGGRYLFVDCYNICEASILATMDAVNDFGIDENKHKWIVLGGENRMGDNAAEAHKEMAYKIAERPLYNLVLFGTDKKDAESINRYGDAYSILEGLKGKGVQDIPVLTQVSELQRYLEENVAIGDLVAIKCVLWLNASIAIDKAFGTGFTYDYKPNLAQAFEVEENGWKGQVMPAFGETEIIGISPLEEGTLRVPDSIEGYPVFRICKWAFKNNESIYNVVFGNQLTNIAQGAFFNCNNIKELFIPGNVKVIERGAFRKCSGLEKVVLEEGVTHIAQNAFRMCGNLTEVVIPATIGNIEDNAFAECPNVVLYCKKGSFGEEYSKINKLEYRYFD